MRRSIVTIDDKALLLTIPQDGLRRSFEIVDSDKAGRLINGNMQRDIIGTYYNYSIDFKTDNLTRAEYDKFYEIISAPVDSHTLTVPYGQDTLTFEAYVTSGEDVLNKIDADGNKWSGITIKFIATSPARRPI